MHAGELTARLYKQISAAGGGKKDVADMYQQERRGLGEIGKQFLNAQVKRNIA